MSLKKIGDSIVYIETIGDISHHDLDKFNNLVDLFCEKSDVVKPYVQIRDLSKSKGRTPFVTVKKRSGYLLDNQDVMLGVVLINEPSWMAPFVNQGIRLFKPRLRVASVKNFDDAVRAARKILDDRCNNIYENSGIPSAKSFQYSDIVFKPEWEYVSSESGFSCRVGCIRQQLLYLSLSGNLNKSDDITNSALLIRRVIDENNLLNIPFIVSNFSDLNAVRSLRLRQQFANEVKKGISDSKNEKAQRILINPDKFNRIALRLFAPFLKTQFLIVDTIDDAFGRINQASEGPDASNRERNIKVSSADLEELSNAFGVLQWGQMEDISKVNVSADNPLAYLLESLELVKNDINDLRENERRLQQEKLHESEMARKMLEKEQESKRILLENIPTQVWYLTDPVTYGAVNKAHAEFLGLKTDELAFKSIYDFFPAEVAAQIKVSNTEVFKKATTIHTEEWAINGKGQRRLLSVVKTPQLFKDGTVEYVVCSAEDITESRLAEQKIYQERERINHILDVTRTAIDIVDSQFNLRYVDKIRENQYGDWTGKKCFEYFHGKESACQECGIHKALETKEKVVSVIHLAKDNRYMEAHTVPFQNEEGEWLVSEMKIDITDRKRVEDELLKSESKHKKMVANIGDVIVIVDREGNNKYKSPNIERMFGWKPEELVGKSALGNIHPEDLDRVSQLIKDLMMKPGYSVQLEARYQCKDGRFKWVAIKAINLLHDPDINGLLGNYHDITERKQYEQMLKYRDEHLRSITETSPTPLMISRLTDGHVLYANDQCARMVGLTLDELLNRKAPDFYFNPEDRKLIIAQLKSNEIAGMEVKLKRADGSPFYALFNARMGRFEGQTAIYLGIQDISDRRKAEKELQQSEARLRTFLSNHPGVAFITDKNGVFQLSEGQGLASLGLKPGQVLGLSVFDVYAHIPKICEHVKMALEGNEQKYDVQVGDYVFESWIGPLTDKKGRIIGVIGISTEITSRIQAEEARQLLQIAQRTAQFKQNFLANMSHEIRTPLTGVLGMIEILDQTTLNELQRDYVQTIKTSGENLREIINQVLDYSKIEAGKIRTYTTVFRFNSLTENAESLYRSSLNKGVKLFNHIDPKIPAYIEADMPRLTQILNNLVSNAIKFTHQGSVSIHSELISLNEKTREVSIRVSVTDTGIGIDPLLQQKLFVPFSQIEAIDTREYEGTGLGLSISRELVQFMGGEIGLISESGKGSTFWFTFNAAIADEVIVENSKTVVFKAGKKLNILLAEDKEVNQKVISLMLKSEGHHIEIARNGLEALEKFEPGKFDLILMDIQMPIMDGVKATQVLKENYNNLCPVVGLSANVFEGDREKYMDLGMDEYLTKPVKKADFTELLIKLHNIQS